MNENGPEPDVEVIAPPPDAAANALLGKAVQAFDERVKALETDLAILRRRQVEAAGLEQAGDADDSGFTSPECWVEGGASSERRLWQLYDRTATTFKVRGAVDENDAALAKEVQIGGVWKTITVSGGSYALGATIDVSAIGAASYLYVNLDKTDGASAGTWQLQLCAKAALPASDDDTEIYPIAYIPFAAAKITWGKVLPIQYGTIHWLSE